MHPCFAFFDVFGVFGDPLVNIVSFTANKDKKRIEKSTGPAILY